MAGSPEVFCILLSFQCAGCPGTREPLKPSPVSSAPDGDCLTGGLWLAWNSKLPESWSYRSSQWCWIPQSGGAVPIWWLLSSKMRWWVLHSSGGELLPPKTPTGLKEKGCLEIFIFRTCFVYVWALTHQWHCWHWWNISSDSLSRHKNFQDGDSGTCLRGSCQETMIREEKWLPQLLPSRQHWEELIKPTGSRGYF